jgi:hypothetical protein
VSYTLAKWALWLIGAAVIGGAVGWLLRGPGRAPLVGVDEDELEALRLRAAEVEPLMIERDRLRRRLSDCRSEMAHARAEAPVRAPLAPIAPLAPLTPLSPASTGDVEAERDRLAAVVGTLEEKIGDLRARLWNQETRIGELQGLLTGRSDDTAPPDPDLEDGALVLGEKVRLNDLTVVEGIGPKIADVLDASGIRTWWQLHNTDVAAISAVLAAAGPLFQVHDPATWPHQGGLLARGEWREFKSLTDTRTSVGARR